MNFQRLENESDEEYIIRVCQMKDKIGYSWEKIAKILNEELNEYHTESMYRKRYKKYKASFGDLEEIDIDKIEQVENDLDNAFYKIREERAKLQAEKVEYNKLIREKARDELLISKIETAISSLPKLSKPVYLKPHSDKRSYLLTIADCHFAIEFQCKDFFGNVINEYSPEIFNERMSLLFSKVVDTVKKEDIKQLEVWNLGDELQGILRLNSQLLQLRYGVVESAILYAEYMATWLTELSKYVRIKYQMVMDSNHNQVRICNAPKNAFPDENMSYVINAFLKERLKDNPNITIYNNPTGMNYSMMSGYSVVGIHGEVKNLSKAINDYSRSYGFPIDYMLGGHIHHSESKEVGIDSEVMSIKSIIGVDPYGLSLNKTANAGANLFVFETGNGKVCEYTYKLN